MLFLFPLADAQGCHLIGTTLSNTNYMNTTVRLIICISVAGTCARAVFVRSYWRVRNGKKEFVRAHWRWI